MKSGRSILQNTVEHVGVRKHNSSFLIRAVRICTVDFNNGVFVLTDPNLSQEARDKIISELNFDSQRLTAFLSSASQVLFLHINDY